MSLTGVEKDTLTGSSLTGINVSHDTEVTGVTQILLCHCFLILLISDGLY
jgi:hypothetical protein